MSALQCDEERSKEIEAAPITREINLKEKGLGDIKLMDVSQVFLSNRRNEGESKSSKSTDPSGLVQMSSATKGAFILDLKASKDDHIVVLKEFGLLENQDPNKLV